MEYLEYNQEFDEESLPDAVPLDAGEKNYNGEVNESVLEGGGKSNNNSSLSVTCSAKLCEKMDNLGVYYHIYIYVFLTYLLKFILHVEALFLINNYFLVFIFKYPTSSL